MVGFVDADRPPGLWGGYATHLYLGPDSMLLPVPAALDPALATMFNPLGAGIRWAVDLPGTEQVTSSPSSAQASAGCARRPRPTVPAPAS